MKETPLSPQLAHRYLLKHGQKTQALNVVMGLTLTVRIPQELAAGTVASHNGEAHDVIGDFNEGNYRE